MRQFAGELREAGFTVDYRKAPNLREGYRAHLREHSPDEVRVTEPNSHAHAQMVEALGLEQVKSNQFLCHRNDFADWASGRKTLKMETFYRARRQQLGFLMEDDQPCGGRWNFDADNREPPPKEDPGWAEPVVSKLDAADQQLLDESADSSIGAPPTGLWATSRRAALVRLRHFINDLLPSFGPHEDAMMLQNWHLAHSLLSPCLNLGLLLPGEVCEAIDQAYRDGSVKINSAEGMLRQVLGWREYMWGIYWLKPEMKDANVLEHRRSLPPSWTGEADTSMNCLAQTLKNLHARGYIHHIQRLMVLSNFANLYGIHPTQVREWMRVRYIDGSDWAMVPNVMGMGLWADGGGISTKPYVSGGAYIRKMSNYCADCPYNPSKRVGDNACPFTTLYWDFLNRHRDKLANNHRLAQQYATLERLKDREQTLDRAEEVIRLIGDGEI
jgi:deoxyribodipyrimidine photolyase-related protein